MRGSPAAAADSPSSLSALLVLVVPACTTPGAAGAAVAAAADGSKLLLLLPPPNTLAQSSGVTPLDAGTRKDATLLAVAYFDRSSTSFGPKLRGTPQPTGATEREECGRPLLLELLRGPAFFPNSSTRPAIERWPSPGGVCALGAEPAAAAALPALPGDATLSAGAATTCCCCSPGTLTASWLNGSGPPPAEVDARPLPALPPPLLGAARGFDNSSCSRLA
jgi:hypothetical protein